MESSTSNRRKLLLPNSNFLPKTSSAPVHQPSTSPDDGYDYHDTEPSPERSATQVQDNVSSSKDDLQTSTDSNTTGNHENNQVENNADYRRPAEGWRARMPDDEDAPNGVSAPGNNRTQWSPTVNRDV